MDVSMVDIKFIERNLSCSEETRRKIRRIIFDDVCKYDEKSITNLIFALPNQAFSFPTTPIIWKSRFSFSRYYKDNIVRDCREMVKDYHYAREIMASGLLGSAMAGEDYKVNNIIYSTRTYDDEYLFSTTHKSKNGKNFSNKFSDELTKESLRGLRQIMNCYKGDSDEYLGIDPDTIVIPNIWGLQEKLCGNIFKNCTMYAEGYDSPKPPRYYKVVTHEKTWRLIMWTYLNRYVRGGNYPWILFDSKRNKLYGNAIWCDRVPLEVISWFSEELDMNVCDGYARSFAGFSDWRAFAVGGCKGGTALET